MSETFKSVADILNSQYFENINTYVKKHRVIEEFFNIFPELQTIANPVKIEKKILFLKVENSVWRNELHIIQKRLCEKINTKFDENLIEKIKFLA